jgi:hypothetical protein
MVKAAELPGLTFVAAAVAVAVACLPCRCALAWTVLACLSLVCMSMADPQAASLCKLTILGGDDGAVQQASMVCTGSTTQSISLNPTHMGPFAGNFTGVDLVPSCTAAYTCLITICSGTIVLRDSNVSSVRGMPLKNLMCVVLDSRLQVENSVFANNKVRLHCGRQSKHGAACQQYHQQRGC